MDWNRLLSRARLGLSRQHPDSEARTDFQRDFDRIVVFSSAFRRLQDKTQVFPLSQSDYVRTRLTHSLEVSSVGRSLGTMVGDSVIRRHDYKGSIRRISARWWPPPALAHDIGNPPFGHAGEDAIRLWFTASATGRAVLEQLNDAQQQDFLRFEGNAQGFRIITRLQSPDNPGGMQLTCATLGHLHQIPARRVAAGRTIRPASPSRNSASIGTTGTCSRKSPESWDWNRYNPAPGAAIRWPIWSRRPTTSATGSSTWRMPSGCNSGLRRGARPAAAADRRAGPRPAQDGHITRSKEKIEYLRAKAIGAIIDQVHQCFMDNEAAILAGAFAEELLDAIPAAEAMRALKACGETQVYVSKPVVEVEAAGFEVLGGLLEAFVTTVNDLAANVVRPPRPRAGC
jgi:dGTPase